jgi:hypothetical protein
MNKEEFCDRTGQKYEEIGEEDWEIIQTVYNYHPLISDVKGKDELCSLFIQGGMGLMRDMHGTAYEICLREDNIQKARVNKEKIDKDYAEKLQELQDWHSEHMNKQADIIRNNTLQIREINERYKS